MLVRSLGLRGIQSNLWRLKVNGGGLRGGRREFIRQPIFSRGYTLTLVNEPSFRQQLKLHLPLQSRPWATEVRGGGLCSRCLLLSERRRWREWIRQPIYQSQDTSFL